MVAWCGLEYTNPGESGSDLLCLEDGEESLF